MFLLLFEMDAFVFMNCPDGESDLVTRRHIIRMLHQNGLKLKK